MGLRGRNSWRRQPRTKKGRWKKLPKKKGLFARRGGRKRKGRDPGERRWTQGPVTVEVQSGNESARKVAARYSAVLRESFTERERRILERDGGVRIVVGRLPGSLLGGYLGKEGGRHQIVLDERSSDSETMTHETIHALQECDRSRPPSERELTLDRVSRKNGADRDELVGVKEALTEAETLSRVPMTDKKSKGYYAELSKQLKRDAGRMKDEDHRTLRSDADAISRGDYVDTTYEKFPDTNISRLRNGNSPRTALETQRVLNRKRGSK